ncbi:MAG: hypothetical protein WD845_13140 [Pirellulales bacterium]
MADYLLPCSCGQKVPVSIRHAGQMVRCVCGAELEVPALRGLRELEGAAGATAPARRAWGDRQRVVFGLAVASLVAFAVAGYLALGLPPGPEPPAVVEIDQNSPIGMVVAVYDDLKRGLDVDLPAPTLVERAQAQRREMLLWGMRIALALGGIGLVAMTVVLLSGKSQKR